MRTAIFGLGFSVFSARRGGNFVHGLIGQRIRFSVLFTVNVVDAERYEGPRHFLGALKERLQVGALDFVLPAHLLDQQFGVALDVQFPHAAGLREVERRDESVVFGDVVGGPADVLLQASDNFTARIADYHAVSGRPWIAARPAVDVRSPCCGCRGCRFRPVVAKQPRAALWRIWFRHHEADTVLELEASAEYESVLGAYRMRPQFSQKCSSRSSARNSS